MTLHFTSILSMYRHVPHVTEEDHSVQRCQHLVARKRTPGLQHRPAPSKADRLSQHVWILTQILDQAFFFFSPKEIIIVRHHKKNTYPTVDVTSITLYSAGALVGLYFG